MTSKLSFSHKFFRKEILRKLQFWRYLWYLASYIHKMYADLKNRLFTNKTWHLHKYNVHNTKNMTCGKCRKILKITDCAQFAFL